LGLGLEFQNNEKFESTAQSLFENLIQKLGNKKAIIPLSGGWDSRFILAGLIKHGFKNIVCFTYGKRNSYEVKIAYQIAEKLDVEWHFVEYKPETFNLYLTEEAWQYEVYASQYTSIAYEQDFFAIHQLKNEGKLPESGVFLPGYCGDLLSGSKTINSNVPHSDDDVLKHILNKHFPKKFDNKKQVEELINSSIKKIEAKDYPALSDEFCAAYETWYYHHKSNKFINNGVRCFEFFGYEWIVPFSTYNYVNFWQNVFFDDRDKERYLYKKNLNKLYFEPLEINFENDTTAEKWSSFSDFLKNVTPQQFKKPIKKLLLKNNEQDVNNLMHFGKMLMDNAGIHEDFDDENIAHAKWLLKKLGL
jgi:asparagine synthase (glutamine-hydrolysing)